MQLEYQAGSGTEGEPAGDPRAGADPARETRR